MTQRLEALDTTQQKCCSIDSTKRFDSVLLIVNEFFSNTNGQATYYEVNKASIKKAVYKWQSVDKMNDVVMTVQPIRQLHLTGSSAGDPSDKIFEVSTTLYGPSSKMTVHAAGHLSVYDKTTVLLDGTIEEYKEFRVCPITAYLEDHIDWKVCPLLRLTLNPLKLKTYTG